MKVAILLALVAMAAARPADDCATCKMVVTEIDAELKSNATVAEIEATVNKICDAIPGIGDECKQYVKQYVPEIVNMIASHITPKEVCDKLKLCNSSFMDELNLANLPLMGPGPVILSPQEDVPLFEPEPAVQQPQAGEFCVICELAMKEIEAQLSANATQAEIIAAVEKVCDILPNTVATECKSLIEQEGPQIINLLINEASPEVVCTALGLCSNASAAAMPLEVGPVMEQEEMPEDSPLCEPCKQVFTYLNSQLSANSTVQEIEAALDNICHYLPGSVQTECEQVVETVTPEVIQLIVANTQPDAICKKLGLCSSFQEIMPVHAIV